VKKVLVVDDEKECCDILRGYLSGRGHLVDVAYNGLQAKELLDDNKYDLICFDCNMPELSGVELAKIIRAKNPKAKKIMMSGYPLINEEFAKKLGVDIFLSKPFPLEELGKFVTT